MNSMSHANTSRSSSFSNSDNVWAWARMRYPKHLSALVAYHVQCRAQSSLHAPFVPWSPNPMPRRMFLGQPKQTRHTRRAARCHSPCPHRARRPPPAASYARHRPENATPVSMNSLTTNALQLNLKRERYRRTRWVRVSEDSRASCPTGASAAAGYDCRG